MPPPENLLQAALDAATQRVRTTLAAVTTRVVETLGGLAEASGRAAERDGLLAAQFDLRRNTGAFLRAFADSLNERITHELAPRESSSRTLAGASWQTLSLVGDAEMDERMFADRVGQSISHACDSELRDLAAYLGGVLPAQRGGVDRHPLRGELLGTALYRAIETVSRDAEPRKLLARELELALAKAMPACDAEIVKALQALDVRPAALTARSVAGPGLGGNSGYATLGGSRSQHGDLEAPAAGAYAEGVSGFARHRTPGGASTAVGGYSTHFGHVDPNSTGAGSLGHRGGSLRSGQEPDTGGPADAQLMSLLRRLTFGVGTSGEAPAPPLAAGHDRPRSASASSFDRWAVSGSPPPRFAADAGGRGQPFGEAALNEVADADGPGSAAGLMAVNLIRTHREELRQASTGQLDHMVIDVVGSLFDQILSDARVPPQMARQIARLQLPVLRVALSDAGFFSSRRHPVRRFVNRMASLACAFDDFDEGPGLQFIVRVRELVQDIVEGDFDQIDLYTAKLSDLERFIAEQTDQEAARSGAPVTLEKKETELRLQQRYRLQLQASLAPLPLQTYLREFLQQVWSQALVLAATRDGVASDRSQRFRRAARDLVLSVQPKGSPAMRKRFLMQLPPLMKDLNEGMALIGWPNAAQQEFFAKLLPAHADSMKLAPMSELDFNMLGRQLEGIFALADPGADTLAAQEVLPEDDAATLERRFTAEEAEAVGLVPESAVDWSGPVDIDLSDEPPPAPTLPGEFDARTTGSPMLDAALDSAPGGPAAAPAEPVRGAELMDHVQLGFAYQMHLKDVWQKVRLTHVSAGRGFFVFSRGRNHQETISMTSRMLARMCQTGRLRAFESAYLMERATQRARRQLAALKMPARVAARVSS